MKAQLTVDDFAPEGGIMAPLLLLVMIERLMLVDRYCNKIRGGRVIVVRSPASDD